MAVSCPDRAGEHEWTVAKIISADFLPGFDGNSDISDGKPAIWTEGTAIFEHTCKNCGEVVRWTV